MNDLREYSSDMQDVDKTTAVYNSRKKRKVLISLDDMINDKTMNSLVTKLFIRGRKLKICIGFITQSYCKVPKEVRVNSTHFLL